MVYGYAVRFAEVQGCFPECNEHIHVCVCVCVVCVIKMS